MMFAPRCALVLTGAFFAAFPLAASAATFSFSGFVIDTPGPAATPDDPNFPPLGTIAFMEFFIDDSDPSLTLEDASDDPGFAEFSISIPGFLFGNALYDPNVSGNDPFFVNASQFSFSAYGTSVVDDPGIDPLAAEALNGISVFWPILGSTPETVGDLVAAVSQAGVTGIGAFEAATEEPGEFYHVRAAFPVDPAGIIPLPGSLLLLSGALTALAALRARRHG